MAQTHSGRKRIRRFFGKIREVAEMPNLIEVQKSSYDLFLKSGDGPAPADGEGIQGVFQSVFPISDFNDTSVIEFVRYELEAPKYDVEECQARDMTYAAPLKVTLRLTDSPACLVADEHDLGMNLSRILKAAGQSAPMSKPILEINPKHPAVLRLVADTIARCNARSKGVSVCGEMAGDVGFTRLLLGLGLRSFSMHPAQILAVKHEILRADTDKLVPWARAVLEADDPAAVFAA